MDRKNKQSVSENILDAVVACKRAAEGGDILITQVSARAGISDRTLNRYFPDKEEMIYLAAVKYLRSMDGLLAERYAACDKAGKNGLECILLLLQMLTQSCCEAPENAFIFVSASATCLRTAINRKILPTGFDDRLRAILLDCIRQGIGDGSLRPELEPSQTYLLLSSGFNGLVQRVIFSWNNHAEGDDQTDKMRRIFDQYILMLTQFLQH